MTDELKLRMTVEGSPESIRKIEAVAKAEKGLKTTTKAVGDEQEKTKKKTGLLMRGLEGLRNSLLGVAGSLTGIFIAALRASRREMLENADAANKLKNAQKDLIFLSNRLRKDELAAVRQASALTGQDEGAVAQSFAQLKSQTSNLNDKQRQDLFQQQVLQSFTTSAPIGSLTNLFSKGSKFISDPKRLGNVIRQTQIESPEASPAKLAQLLPSVLAIGREAGLRPEQSAGMFAFAAGRTGTAEEGKTGVRNIISILQGGATPEGLKILKGAGATQDKGVLGQLKSLSKAGLSLGDFTKIFGRENSAVASSFARDPEALFDTIGRIEEAGASKRNLTRDAVQDIFSKDRSLQLQVITAQAKARIQSIKARDIGSQEANAAKVLAEEQALIEGKGAFRRDFDALGFDVRRFLGGDGAESAAFIGGDASDRAVRKGLRGPDLDVTKITIVAQQFNTGGDPFEQDSGQRDR